MVLGVLLWRSFQNDQYKRYLVTTGYRDGCLRKAWLHTEKAQNTCETRLVHRVSFKLAFPVAHGTLELTHHGRSYCAFQLFTLHGERKPPQCDVRRSRLLKLHAPRPKSVDAAVIGPTSKRQAQRRSQKVLQTPYYKQLKRAPSHDLYAELRVQVPPRTHNWAFSD
jgi:hypothetical protein